MMNSAHSAKTSPAFWRSKPGIALGMLLVIALFYLARDTTAICWAYCLI